MSTKTFVATMALVLAGTVTAAPVLAGTPGLDRREHHQVQRIRQGVRSGELTRAETARLMHGQAQLRRSEARAKSDGVVTARERARLQHKADVQSRHIYRQKHDAQDRN